MSGTTYRLADTRGSTDPGRTTKVNRAHTHAVRPDEGGSAVAVPLHFLDGKLLEMGGRSGKQSEAVVATVLADADINVVVASIGALEQVFGDSHIRKRVEDHGFRIELRRLEDLGSQKAAGVVRVDVSFLVLVVRIGEFLVVHLLAVPFDWAAALLDERPEVAAVRTAVDVVAEVRQVVEVVQLDVSKALVVLGLPEVVGGLGRRHGHGQSHGEQNENEGTQLTHVISPVKNVVLMVDDLATAAECVRRKSTCCRGPAPHPAPRRRRARALGCGRWADEAEGYRRSSTSGGRRNRS